MKTSAFKYLILTVLSNIVLLILFLIPFHAFLTVWLSTAVGHYTVLRLWKEVLLAISAIGVLFLLLTDSKIRSHTLSRRLVWLIIGYISLFLLLGIVAYEQHKVTEKALGYSLIANTRFLIFFLVAWSVTLRTSRLHRLWLKVAVAPLVIVTVFGLLQEFVLPQHFLEHFGYSKHTILPFQYVDNNADFFRIQSTLRGANPLGAYLVVGLSILWARMSVLGHPRRHLRAIALVILAMVTLYFTYSRSAWIGAILAGAVIGWQRAKKYILKYHMPLAVVVLVVAAGIGFTIGHNRYVQNTILHTSQGSHSPVSSNEQRSNDMLNGLHDIYHQPLGRGPGTAGPESVYNQPRPGRIAENYFIQIGQEIGILGILVFVLINIGVGYLLWLRRDEPLALSLFASLIGLTFVNLLSHAWSDDTLAYLWWGLAGIAMVKPAMPTKTVMTKKK